MTNTFYLKEKKFVPVDCEKLAFEELSLQSAMEDIKSIDIKDFKDKIEINEVETLNILENLLDDFSCVDLKKEIIDLRLYVKKPHKKREFRERIVNLLNTDVSTPLCDLLNTDVSTPLQELMATDVATPLQEAFDNIISMISLNKQE